VNRQKILYILRHAKAEVGTAAQDDHERELAPRGLKDANAMGKYLAAQKIHPGKVLCSTAVRARQTLDQLQGVFRDKLTVEYTPKLYMASAKDILKLIAATPGDVSSLLIVGHNPGFHELSLVLAKQGDGDMLEDIRLKFPTCAFAALALDTQWPEVAHARGTLKQFVVPKEL